MTFECNPEGVQKMAKALDDGSAVEFNSLAKEYLNISSFSKETDRSLAHEKRNECLLEVADTEQPGVGYDMVNLDYKTVLSGYKGASIRSNTPAFLNFQLERNTENEKK